MCYNAAKITIQLSCNQPAIIQKAGYAVEIKLVQCGGSCMYACTY